MVAILVIWPGPFEQTFAPLFHGGSIWNLASIGPVVSEKKMFKDGVDGRRRKTTDGRRSHPKLAHESKGSGDLINGL